MKAAALIKEVRESTQHLYDSYQKYLETDGKMGLCCFDPDLLEERLKRSDRGHPIKYYLCIVLRLVAI